MPELRWPRFWDLMCISMVIWNLRSQSEESGSGLTITEGTEGQFGATTLDLGALESSLLFCYSLTCNGLGALSCPFKMALKMGALQNSYFEAWSGCVIMFSSIILFVKFKMLLILLNANTNPDIQTMATTYGMKISMKLLKNCFPHMTMAMLMNNSWRQPAGSHYGQRNKT